MFRFLKKTFEKRQATAGDQLAAIAGISDFTTPLSVRESESYIPWVLACVDFIAKSVSSLPVRLCRRQGTEKEVIEDHAVAELLKNPHPRLDGGMTEILLFATTELLSYGNAIILIDEIDKKPALVPIPYGYVVFPYRENNAGYRITYPDQETVVVPQSRVCHLKIGSTDTYIGRSPLARGHATIGLIKLVEQATSSLWTQGVYPSLIFKTTKKQQESQRQANRQYLMTHLSGKNRGRPLFLDHDYNIEKVPVNSKDLEHLNQRMLGIVQICAIFGCSPVLACSDLRYGTYSNYSEARKAWAQDGLSIYQKLFSNVLSKKLVGDEPDLYVELDSSHLLQDRDAKMKELIELTKAGILTKEEAKAEAGYA